MYREELTVEEAAPIYFRVRLRWGGDDVCGVADPATRDVWTGFLFFFCLLFLYYNQFILKLFFEQNWNSFFFLFILTNLY